VDVLRRQYPAAEAQAIVRALLRDLWPDWEIQWLTTLGQALVPEALQAVWWDRLERLVQGEPLAYVTEQASFLGHNLMVRKGVFIPRPETELWVAWMIQHLQGRPPQRILEVGVGSGAILIALGKAFPDAALYGIDCSPLAVQLTIMNAQRHLYTVQVERRDFLLEGLPEAWQPLYWDLIISNPPYIPWSDRSLVAPNVLHQEPSEALFCERLEFYEALREISRKSLSEGGLLVVELYPPTALEVADLYISQDFLVELYRDLEGRWRWAVIKRK